MDSLALVMPSCECGVHIQNKNKLVSLRIGAQTTSHLQATKILKVKAADDKEWTKFKDLPTRHDKDV